MSGSQSNDNDSRTFPKATPPRPSPTLPVSKTENRVSMAKITPQSIIPTLESDVEALPLTTISDDRTKGKTSEAGYFTINSTNLLPEAATTFHHFPKFPPEIRLMIWSLALPKQRVVEILPSNVRYSLTSPLPPYSLIARRHSIALLSVCQESREVALASKNLEFLPAGEGARYLTPNAITILFPDVDTMQEIMVCGHNRHNVEIRTELSKSTLTLAINPFSGATRSSQGQIDLAGEFVVDFFHLMLLIGRLRSLKAVKEVILCFAKEDMAFLPGVEKFRVRKWKKRMERALRRDKKDRGWITWKIPQISTLVYERKMALSQTQALADGDLPLVRDLLSGLKAS